jgi:ribonuclease HI
VKPLDIYIDGAAKGNPGPAGIGAVIYQDSRILKNLSKFIGNATNNVAEYTALIYALQEALILKADKIRLWTDSELLCKQIQGEYRVRHSNLKPLYEQIKNLSRGFSSFEIHHLSRTQNCGADKLANQAIKEAKIK